MPSVRFLSTPFHTYGKVFRDGRVRRRGQSGLTPNPHASPKAKESGRGREYANVFLKSTT
ncbi:hypothetical protein SBA3_4270003 [Candidatus Sulfopaludibacter sp. SbA3]|nr:hypothetical protein SBA3_4270003 [Candidatus Sulfopaludibacter sp. SbA3]